MVCMPNGFHTKVVEKQLLLYLVSRELLMLVIHAMLLVTLICTLLQFQVMRG